jgi:hypothetical protein
MANGLLDLLGGALGTTPPAYLQGLLGENAVEDLRKRSIGSGLVNALIGYAAAPKNQNLGLGRILAGAAQSGIQGAQNVYQGATQDYMMQQRIAEMKRQQDQDIASRNAIDMLLQRPEVANDPMATAFIRSNPAEALKMYATPRERKTATVGNQIVDLNTNKVIFTGEKELKAPPTYKVQRGRTEYTIQIQPDGTEKIIGQGSMDAPQQPKEPPTSIQEYNFARSQGYTGTFDKFQKEIKQAGATSINMPSESERTAGFLTSRLQNALSQINQVITKNPNAAAPKIGAEAVQFLTGSDYLKNLANPENRQQIESAQLELLDSALTLGTGAAYTREQLQNYSKSYFPQLGDKPANIADKKNRLNALLKSANIKAGRAAPADFGLPANVTVERVK